MTDAIAQIAAERSAAQQAVAAAEQLMRQQAGDARAFARAKRQRKSAEEALERLAWAEAAERERRAGAERQAKLDQLADQRERAAAERAKIKQRRGDVAAAVATLEDVARAALQAQAVVDKAAHHERFALNEGLVDRQEVIPRLPLDGEVAVRALAAVNEIVKLSPVNPDVARTRAMQRRA